MALELGVDLPAEQHGERGEVQPQHHHDDCTERAVRLVVLAEVRGVDRERDRADRPEDRCDERSRRRPAPTRLGTIGRVAIHERQAQDHAAEEDHPAQHIREHPAHDPETCVGKGGRHDGNGREGDDEEQHCAKGEHECHGLAVDEAPLLLLVVRNVERIHQVSDTGRGRPERNEDSEDGRDHTRTARRGSDRGELTGDEVTHLARRGRQRAHHLSTDRARLGHEPVDRDQGHQPGHQGQQRVESDPRREQRDVVLLRLGLHAHEDVAPFLRRKLARPLGISPVFGRRVGVPHLVRLVIHRV